uniref:AIG1-type G domain-containing protein n=1 Tax=Amphimedon queenslandica TaxID=400682 RepID=A0A1X7SEQ5_AMPQE
MKVYRGTFVGVKLWVYDTVGFGDTRGRSDQSIIEEIAEANRFDLILVCVKMDNRVDKKGVQPMFTTLSTKMPTEAWKRTVVVLTFANFFLEQINIPPLTPEEEKQEFTKAIDDFKDLISKAAQEVFSDVPFCIAGCPYKKRKFPTTDDWLYDLWCTCLQRCSDEALPALQAYSVYATIISWGAAGVVIGGGVGAGIGRVAGTAADSGGGTALGAALAARTGGVIGSAAGGALGGVVGCVIAAVQKISTK